mgnify:FL=1
MWYKCFAVIILLSLFACTGKQTEQNLKSIRIEKKWAKDCNQNSKIHILASNAQLINGNRVLTSNQKYIKMTEDCINDVETLIFEYLDKKDNNHYFDKQNNVLNCYFRQYLCNKDNTQFFVFVNLYAYRITRYEENTTNAFASTPLVDVINPLNGNNKDYKMFIVNLSEKSIHCFTKE